MKAPWKWIIGWAVLIHVILIAASIVEVIIYAYAVNPGQPELIYEQHAQLTAPWVSIIGGLFLFFLVARKLSKNRFEQRKVIGLALPALYIILDVGMLLMSDVNWGEDYMIFVISFSSKTLASYVGAMTVKPKE